MIEAGTDGGSQWESNQCAEYPQANLQTLETPKTPEQAKEPRSAYTHVQDQFVRHSPEWRHLPIYLLASDGPELIANPTIMEMEIAGPLYQRLEDGEERLMGRYLRWRLASTISAEFRRWVKTAMRRLDSSARNRGLTNTLAESELLTLARRSKGCCELTGLKFEFDQKPGWKRHPLGPSIDRIDPERGYEVDNCRLICLALNIAINEWGESVYRQVAEAYRTNSLKSDPAGRVLVR